MTEFETKFETKFVDRDTFESDVKSIINADN